jgi:hypothetical protein
MKSCKTLKGGLQEVADDLGVSGFHHCSLRVELTRLLPTSIGFADRPATSSRLR